MTALRATLPNRTARSIEDQFPIVPLSRLAERESWRKELGRPLYHIHKWWATRLGSVFRAIVLSALSDSSADPWRDFYKVHDFSDKVVLDPFMGSGTTLGEALKLGCSVVGCDINPVSTFLVRQALTPVSEARLKAAFRAVEDDISADIKRYYMTRDPQTDALIPVLYAFWVKELVTPTGERIPLFSSYVFAQDAYAKRKPAAHLVCPHCWGVFGARFDSISVTCPLCSTWFNPQAGPAKGQYLNGKDGTRYRVKELLAKDGRPPEERLYALMALRPDGRKIYLAPCEEDHALCHEAAKRLASSNLPLPTAKVLPGHNTDQARGYNYLEWADFFNSRQKLCLGLLLQSILKLEDIEAQEQMLCLFSSTLEFNNRFCSFKGEGTGAVRHMFSHHILKPERTPLENSVWGTTKSSGTFASLFESRLLPAKRYLDEPFELGGQPELFDEGNAIRGKTVASAPMRPVLVDRLNSIRARQSAVVLNGDSAALPLPDQCVDAVVTDPPYFDFVHYSELSDFFFAWLKPVLEERYPWFAKDDCRSTGEVQHRDAGTFARQLGGVLTESARVLKDDGVLVFSFHHSRSEGWGAIYDALSSAGFGVVASHPIHAELRAASPKNAARDPISLDAILVCRKTGFASLAPLVDHVIVARARERAAELRAGGLSISSADEFVIVASELLVGMGGAARQTPTSFEGRLDRLREMLAA